MILLRRIFLFLLITFGSFGEMHAQTTTTKQIRKDAKKWFKQKSWSNGLVIKPDKSVNTLEFYRQYNKNKAAWDKAFEFLRTHDLKALAKGKYPIDGDNVFASVTENPSKDFDSTTWESHHNYIDLQYVIEGEERIGVAPAAGATVTKPYDAGKDVMNYSIEGEYYKATPKHFFLFFPSDAHRPNITPGGNKVVKKIVVKIKVAD